MQYRIRNGDTLLVTIGDGNLYSGSADFSGNWFNAHDHWKREPSWDDPLGHYVWTYSNQAWYGLGQTVYVDKGTYTFSCYVWFAPAKSEDYLTFFAGDARYNGTAKIDSSIGTLSGNPHKWTHVVKTFQVTTAGNLVIRPELDQGSGQVWVGSYCLQKGATDGTWAPNPSDYGISDRKHALRMNTLYPQSNGIDQLMPRLTPNTSYTLSVAPFNGIREGQKSTITVKTRGIQIKVPRTIAVGTTVTLNYEEYPLGLVPIGTEPKGMFGGGNKQSLPAKCVSTSNGTSVLEITNQFNSMQDGQTMKQLADGSFAVFQDYKALYLK